MEVSSEPTHSPESALWTRRTLWLLGGLLLWRIAYLALCPMDLVHDESYYWDWSRQLDYGYYSKPPMIAWAIGASTAVLGDTPFGVRFPAVLLGTLGLGFIFLLARRMYDAQTAFWATTLAALTPGNGAMALIMTIDAPFLFFWCGALYTFWRMLERDHLRPWWLLATLLLIGLGLLSKQTMLGLLVFGGLFVISSKEDRHEVLRPGLWLTAVGGLLFLLPVLLWNWQHDWITLQHTSEHFQGQSVSALRRVTVSLEFFGGLFGVVSPVTFFLYLVVGLACCVSVTKLDRRAKYLVLLSIVPLLLVGVLSLKQRIELNWPAPFFPAGIILVSAWAMGHLPVSVPWLSPREFRLKHAALVSLIFLLATYALPLATGPLNLAGGTMDPIVRLRGWHALGQATGAEIAKHRTPSQAEPLLIVAAGREIASELAFYLPHQPRLYQWSGNRVPQSQYDIWGGPAGDHQGREAILITRLDQPPPPPLQAAFYQIERLTDIHIPIGHHGREHAITLWRGVRFQGWPEVEAKPTTQLARPEIGRRR
ncbi:MAG: glycosyltransferase family 39 protein [Pirellulaceae bacterium]